jgi:hypothetical protein
MPLHENCATNDGTDLGLHLDSATMMIWSAVVTRVSFFRLPCKNCLTLGNTRPRLHVEADSDFNSIILKISENMVSRSDDLQSAIRTSSKASLLSRRARVEAMSTCSQGLEDASIVTWNMRDGLNATLDIMTAWQKRT